MMKEILKYSKNFLSKNNYRKNLLNPIIQQINNKIYLVFADGFSILRIDLSNYMLVDVIENSLTFDKKHLELIKKIDTKKILIGKESISFIDKDRTCYSFNCKKTDGINLDSLYSKIEESFDLPFKIPVIDLMMPLNFKFKKIEHNRCILSLSPDRLILDLLELDEELEFRKGTLATFNHEVFLNLSKVLKVENINCKVEISYSGDSFKSPFMFSLTGFDVLVMPTITIIKEA